MSLDNLIALALIVVLVRGWPPTAAAMTSRPRHRLPRVDESDTFTRAIRAADRITDPVERGEILVDAGARPDFATGKWRLRYAGPEPVPGTLALRCLYLHRPDLIP